MGWYQKGKNQEGKTNLEQEIVSGSGISWTGKRSFPGQALSWTDDSRTRRFPDIQRRCSIRIDTSY